ncbi:helix-turn-helix domain-containing protein [soil metagenome]
MLQTLKAASTPQSVNDLAEQLDVHPNTVRFHLTRLLAGGQVERMVSTPGDTGRPAQLFGPTQGMDPSGPRGYQVLAEVLVAGLADGPGPGASALQAGRSWGRQQAQSRPVQPNEVAAGPGDAVAQLVSLLDEIGFAPEWDGAYDQAAIELRHCPFLELTRTQSAIVCPIHLGLMQGALEAWDAPVGVARLEPFVEPDVCLAHLSIRGAS